MLVTSPRILVNAPRIHYNRRVCRHCVARQSGFIECSGKWTEAGRGSASASTLGFHYNVSLLSLKVTHATLWLMPAAVDANPDIYPPNRLTWNVPVSVISWYWLRRS